MVVEASNDGQAAAVLCSGGLDSAVLLAVEGRTRPIQPIYIGVGFPWEPAERAMLERLLAAPAFRGARPVARLELSMRDVYPASHWAMRGDPPAYDTPDTDVYVTGRNVMLLGQAAVFCAAHGIGRLALGSLADNPFPDATASFFGAMGRALSLGLAHELAIVAPLRTQQKADVIKQGLNLGVPLALTLSCMRPAGLRHCGLCSKCRERRDAFHEAGVPDPSEYAAASPR